MGDDSDNKLNPKFRDFRLCTLHPGSLDVTLVCTVSAIPLNGKPERETLSYFGVIPRSTRRLPKIAMFCVLQKVFTQHFIVFDSLRLLESSGLMAYASTKKMFMSGRLRSP